MKKLALIAVLFVVSGCNMMPDSVFLTQQPAVKAATESATSASANWAKYNADQQKAFLAANQKAWEQFNRVYNPAPAPAAPAAAPAAKPVQ